MVKLGADPHVAGEGSYRLRDSISLYLFVLAACVFAMLAATLAQFFRWVTA
jgi:hypothetical protein